MKLYYRRGFREAVVVSVLITLVTIVLPEYYPHLFVKPSGNIKIFGKLLGTVFSIGILLRWRWLRPILALAFGFTFMFTMWWLATHPDFLPGSTLLAILQLVLIWLLVHSENLKEYLS